MTELTRVRVGSGARVGVMVGPLLLVAVLGLALFGGRPASKASGPAPIGAAPLATADAVPSAVAAPVVAIPRSPAIVYIPWPAIPRLESIAAARFGRVPFAVPTIARGRSARRAPSAPYER
ncbi:MAG TPA: hypothetical protein VIM39_13545 [Candidatus Limnocylindrales bacterium]